MTNTLANDAEDLTGFPATRSVNPRTGTKTLTAKTVCEAGFRNMTYVRDLAPVPVGEQLALLGVDGAPNPSETALAALGSCILVGLLGNATHRGVTLTKNQIEMAGDIDISALWGAGDIPGGTIPGFTEVRCQVALAGDADEKTLQHIQDNTIGWSPVANTFRRPAAVDSTLVIE